MTAESYPRRERRSEFDQVSNYYTRETARTESVRPSDIKNLPSSFQMNLSYGAEFTSMSIIRRYFLFFVFLDLAVHLFVYLLYLKHACDFSLIDLVGCQMKCYDIETSLVDVMMLAAGRFLILEFAYGLGRSDSWVGTALTTAITNVFVIVKPFHYDWEFECQRVLPVSLILLSFILAWLEAFLVDFQLIQMENLAQKYAAASPEVFRKNFPKVGFLKSFIPITRNLWRDLSDSLDFAGFSTTRRDH